MKTSASDKEDKDTAKDLIVSKKVYYNKRYPDIVSISRVYGDGYSRQPMEYHVQLVEYVE